MKWYIIHGEPVYLDYLGEHETYEDAWSFATNVYRISEHDIIQVMSEIDKDLIRISL